MGNETHDRRNDTRDVVTRLIDEWRVERPDLDATAMDVVGRILVLGQKLSARASKALNTHDLIIYSDFDVLATLRRSGPPYELTPTELMQSVLITSGAMTALLDRLTARGLIKRAQDRHDKRVRTAVLTRKGRTLIDKAIETRFDEARDAIACFSKREQAQLAELLNTMTEWLEDASETPTTDES